MYTLAVHLATREVPRGAGYPVSHSSGDRRLVHATNDGEQPHETFTRHCTVFRVVVWLTVGHDGRSTCFVDIILIERLRNPPYGRTTYHGAGMAPRLRQGSHHRRRGCLPLIPPNPSRRTSEGFRTLGIAVGENRRRFYKAFQAPTLTNG